MEEKNTKEDIHSASLEKNNLASREMPILKSYIVVNKREVEKRIKELLEAIDYSLSAEDKARGYFEIALLYKHLLKDYHQCTKNLEEAFIRKKSDVLILRELIVTYLKIGELNKALERYKKHRAMFVTTPEHCDILDNILLFITGKEELREYEKELLETRISLNPEDYKYLLKLEQLYLLAHNYRKLYRLYKKYLSVFHKIREGYMLARDFLKVTKRVNPPRDAVREFFILFDAATFTRSSIIHELWSLIDAADEWEKFFDILQTYFETQKAEYDVSSIYAFLGNVAEEKLKKKQKAKEFFFKALEKNPGNALASLYLEKILLQEGNKEELLTLYNKKMEKLPQDLRIKYYGDLCDVYTTLGNKQAAVKSYQNLIKHHVYNPSLSLKIKHLLREEKNYEALFIILQEEVLLCQYEEQKKECYEELAYLLEEKFGQFLEAAHFYAEAFSISQKLDSNFFQVERIYRSLGEWEKLLQFYQKAKTVVTETDRYTIDRALSYVFEYQQKDLKSLEIILAEMYKRDSHDYSVFLRLIDVYRANKSYEKLARLYLQSTQSSTSDERMTLISRYTQNFEPSEKAFLYEKLLQSINDKEGQIKILNILGTLYKDTLHDKEKAEIAFSEILYLNPLETYAKEALEQLAILKKTC